jgi:chorismate mutase
MQLAALRGAITVEENSRQAILEATREMLGALAAANRISPEHVVAATFSATPDLDAAYPAEAAREMGWRQAGLLCLQEMAVTDSLPMCLRVLVLYRTGTSQAEIRHCYLGGAKVLRPDLAAGDRD